MDTELKNNLTVLNKLIKLHEKELQILREFLFQLKDDVEILKDSFLEQNEILSNCIKEKNDFNNFVEKIKLQKNESFIKTPREYNLDL